MADTAGRRGDPDGLRGVSVSGPARPAAGRVPAPHQTLAYRAAEFLRRLWTKSLEDDVLFMAGAVAFNLLVALVPLLVLGIGLSGYVLSARFGDPVQVILGLLGDYVPAGGAGVDVSGPLRGAVERLLAERGGLTLFGALFFVWVATRLVGSVRSTLREIFDIGQSRGIIAGKIFDVVAVVVGVVLLTLNLGVTVALEAAVGLGVEFLGLGGPVLNTTEKVSGHAVAFASIWILFLGVYRYLPARRVPWRTALVAATFTAALHELLKGGFTWYATEVANYSSTLGTLAAVAVLFFWIYYEAVVFILGGEVAQVYTMRQAIKVQVHNAREPSV